MRTVRRCRWWILLTAMIPLASLLAPLRADEFVTRVSAGADDAKIYGAYVELGASDALVGYTGYYRCDFGVRFANVAVPQGAAIDSAFLLLRVSSSQAGTVCSAEILAEDTAGAMPFSTYADYAARRTGDNVVSWNDLPPMTAGTWQRTPDIAAIVGEIAGRSDWLPGNPLAVFLRDNNSSASANRRFSQYDANSTYACSLFVYYSTEPGPEEQPVFRRRSLLVNPLSAAPSETGWHLTEYLLEKEARCAD